jgi:hypothetical protein
MFGADGDGVIRNTTITHNAPLGHGVKIEDFVIGGNVYLTGNVFKFNEETRLYEAATDETNCIPSVKASGGVRDWLGICCGKLRRGDKNIGQDIVEFATHGDVYVKVTDSGNYEIGDILLNDGSILGENMVITGLVRRMIVGQITAKINKQIVSVMMGG